MRELPQQGIDATPRYSSNESTKALGENSSRSDICSPTPTKRTGRLSSCAMATAMPPLAVPSSLVRTMPVTPADCVKRRACRRPFWPVVASMTSRTSWGASGIAREAVAIGAGTLWCQFGVINADGAKIAEDGGVTVIMDRCLKVEHARYVGRMHWCVFNAQRFGLGLAGLQ